MNSYVLKQIAADSLMHYLVIPTAITYATTVTTNYTIHSVQK